MPHSVSSRFACNNESPPYSPPLPNRYTNYPILKDTHPSCPILSLSKPRIMYASRDCSSHRSCPRHTPTYTPIDDDPHEMPLMHTSASANSTMPVTRNTCSLQHPCSTLTISPMVQRKHAESHHVRCRLMLACLDLQASHVCAQRPRSVVCYMRLPLHRFHESTVRNVVQRYTVTLLPLYITGMHFHMQFADVFRCRSC